MTKAQKKTEIVSVTSQENLPAIGFGSFRIKKLVTLPTFKIEENTPTIFRVDGEIYEGKKLAGSKEDAGKKPACLMPVTKIDAETGESFQGQIVVGTVLRETLLETYPDGAYVGLTFGILKMPKKDGKQYKEYQIVELDVE